MEAPMNEGSVAAAPSQDKLVGDQHKSSENNNHDNEEANIAKALRFWKHPSLRDIPMEQKCQYLYEKGVTDRHIHKAWDRILEEKLEEDLQAPPTASNVSSTVSPAGPTSTDRAYLNPTHPHHSPTNSPYPSQDYSYRPSSPYPPPVAAYAYADEEGPGPFLQGVSLVALGGMVGLTAAAAVRWLNGGDFQLLPPPALHDKVMHHQRLTLRDDGRRPAEDSNTTTYDDEDGNRDFDDDDDNDPSNTVEEEYTTEEEEMENSPLLPPDPAQENLLQEVKSISDSMKAHVTLQEKILQKLSSQGSSITNHSMELLRASSGVTTGISGRNGDRDDSSSRKTSSPEVLLLWAQLLEIKTELRNLQHNPAHQRQKCDDVSENGGEFNAWESQLAALLPKLQECIEAIQNIFTPPLPDKAKSLSVPSGTMTPITPSADPSSSSAVAPTQVAGTPVKEHLSLTENEDAIGSPDPSPRAHTLRQAVRRMAQENDATTLRVGSQLLYLYIINLMANPSNPRYRKIFTTNESFQKVETVVGGKDLLLAVGFEERQGCLEWLVATTTTHSSSSEAEGLAMAKLQEAAAALGILKAGQPSADLTQRALAVVSLDPDDGHLLAPPPVLPHPSPLDGPSSISSSPQSDGGSDMGNVEEGDNAITKDVNVI